MKQSNTEKRTISKRSTSKQGKSIKNNIFLILKNENLLKIKKAFDKTSIKRVSKIKDSTNKSIKTFNKQVEIYEDKVLIDNVKRPPLNFNRLLSYKIPKPVDEMIVHYEKTMPYVPNLNKNLFEKSSIIDKAYSNITNEQGIEETNKVKEEIRYISKLKRLVDDKICVQINNNNENDYVYSLNQSNLSDNLKTSRSSKEEYRLKEEIEKLRKENEDKKEYIQYMDNKYNRIKRQNTVLNILQNQNGMTSLNNMNNVLNTISNDNLKGGSKLFKSNYKKYSPNKTISNTLKGYGKVFKIQNTIKSKSSSLVDNEIDKERDESNDKDLNNEDSKNLNTIQTQSSKDTISNSNQTKEEMSKGYIRKKSYSNIQNTHNKTKKTNKTLLNMKISIQNQSKNSQFQLQSNTNMLEKRKFNIKRNSINKESEENKVYIKNSIIKKDQMNNSQNKKITFSKSNSLLVYGNNTLRKIRAESIINSDKNNKEVLTRIENDNCIYIKNENEDDNDNEVNYNEHITINTINTKRHTKQDKEYPIENDELNRKIEINKITNRILNRKFESKSKSLCLLNTNTNTVFDDINSYFSFFKTQKDMPILFENKTFNNKKALDCIHKLQNSCNFNSKTMKNMIFDGFDSFTKAKDYFDKVKGINKRIYSLDKSMINRLSRIEFNMN